jgi:putative ABC transport system substrate-binding protein
VHTGRKRPARKASYVAKIFKGAKPAELPVELPDAVRALRQPEDREGLGITVPQSILVRADRVIE